jgi:hypothetical protein
VFLMLLSGCAGVSPKTDFHTLKVDGACAPRHQSRRFHLIWFSG